MTLSLRNLDWLRRLEIPGVQAAGARFHELISDMKKGVETMEQQTSSNMNGTPAAPPAIQNFTVQPHENGVEFAITHTGEMYRGVHYLIDHSETPHFQNARSVDVGETRNGFIPVGPRTLYYQVRAKYPWSDSTSPVFHGVSSPASVTGGTASIALLPSQGCGTAKPGRQALSTRRFACTRRNPRNGGIWIPISSRFEQLFRSLR